MLHNPRTLNEWQEGGFDGQSARRAIVARSLYPAKPGKFFFDKELVPPLLAVLYEASRASAVGLQVRGFREIEHLSHYLEDSVHLVESVPVPMVQRRDALTCEFVDGEFAEFRQRESLDQPAPVCDSSRPAAHFDMLRQTPLREVGDREGVCSQHDYDTPDVTLANERLLDDAELGERLGHLQHWRDLGTLDVTHHIPEDVTRNCSGPGEGEFT